MRVVGVDGCPGGWVAATWNAEKGTLSPSFHPSFEDLLNTFPSDAEIGIDIPIGLSEGERRQCDCEARKVLGRRRSSVFPAPDRRFLDAIAGIEAMNYGDALALCRAITGKGISQQGFAISPKIAEIDQVITPALQERVVEVHPEVSFWRLADRQPMRHPKRKAEGFAERLTLLAAALDLRISSRAEARAWAPFAKPDDVLDAAVAAWTARRVAEDNAKRLPSNPPVDRRGLRMEIMF